MRDRSTSRGGEIVLGYLAACLTAGLSLVAGTSVLGAISTGAISWPQLDWLMALPFGLFLALWAAVLALLPSVLVIILAERRGMRSVGAHLCFGALIGICAYALFLLAGLGLSGEFGLADLRRLARAFSPGTTLVAAGLFGGAGALGGLVYRRIAGRHAGSPEARGVS
jgi:hypothetical protein